MTAPTDDIARTLADRAAAARRAACLLLMAAGDEHPAVSLDVTAHPFAYVADPVRLQAMGPTEATVRAAVDGIVAQFDAPAPTITTNDHGSTYGSSFVVTGVPVAVYARVAVTS